MSRTAVVSKDFPVMDCDGHILEPGTIWTEHVEPEYREAVRGGLWKVDHPDGGWDIHLNGSLHAQIPGGAAFFGAVLRPGVKKEELARLKMNVDEFPIVQGAFDPRARLHDMDLMGIDQVMLLPTYCGMTFTSIEDPKAALGLARAYNNWISDYCKTDPSRLFAAGIIPQHDNDDAVSEVKRLAEMDVRCVIIRPNLVAGRYPTHQSFDPVWQAIEETGIVAGIHPFPATPGAPPGCSAWFMDRVAEGSDLLWGIAGESICFTHDAQIFLMMAFHKDLYSRFPNLKLAVLESNASWLPGMLSKADERVRIWTATRGSEVKSVPSETFTSRSWISFESDETTVFEMWRRFVNIGVWASDYPHFDAEDAWEAIEHMRASGVPDDALAKMLGGNAYEMYGIQPQLSVTERVFASQDVGTPA